MNSTRHPMTPIALPTSNGGRRLCRRWISYVAHSQVRRHASHFGDELNPDQISARLGASPTDSHRKGDVKHLRNSEEYVHKTGMWRLNAADCEPEDLDGQVNELLAALTTDLSVWKDLSERNQIDLFRGLVMDESNEGFGLSSSTLTALAVRGIEIDFDVYAPTQDIAASTPCPCGSNSSYGECCALKIRA